MASQSSKSGLSTEDRAKAHAFASTLRELREQLSRRIVGQDEVITLLLAAILAEGHCLLIGVPGLAKTLLIRSIADLLSVTFKRIQFTPDLMPSDITGAATIHQDSTGQRDFQFLRGPIFANVILADEINRTPPKTQAALMEAMEERQISIAGKQAPLERPFFVLATQNPIEQEGTYPLPVSQMDRFLFNITIDYPTAEEEFRILLQTTSMYTSSLETILGRDQLVDILDVARRIEVSERLLDYASRIIRGTRPENKQAPEFIRETVAWGGGPRATQALLGAAKAMALIEGRDRVTPDDLHAVALPALRHRIILKYHAQAEGIQPDDVIRRLLTSLPDGLYSSPESVQPAPRKGFFARLWA